MKRISDLLGIAALAAVLCGTTFEGAQAFGLPGAGTKPPSSGSPSVTYMGVKYDFPAAGESTWFYRVRSDGPPAISHVVFELTCPELLILDAGTWDGTDTTSLNSGAGNPEPDEFPSAGQRDPTTRMTGLKFDRGFDDYETRYYYFTLNDNYTKGEIDYAIKAAWWVISGSVTGPACASIPPSASLALRKTGTMVYNPVIDCDVLGLAKAFNALIFGDFTAVGGDTENRLAVGGTAHFSGGYSVGIPIYGNPISTYYGDAVDMLIVGGDLHDDNWSVNGNIVYGGTRYGPERHMANGNIVRQVVPVTFDEQGNVPADGSGVSFADLHARMIARGALLGALPDRGVVRKEVVPPYNAYFTGDDPQLNVFNVTAPSGGVMNSRIDITAPPGATVLVNIHGGAVRYMNATMVLTGVGRETVLFNYVTATQLVVSGFNHECSVLAPHASATLVGGAVEGQAVFGGDVVTHTGYEFHNYPFQGRICVESEIFESHIVYNFTVHNSGPVPLTNIVVVDPKLPVTGGPIALNPGESNTTAFSGVYVLTAEEIAAGSFSNTATATGWTPAGQQVSASAYDVQLFAQPGPFIHASGGGGDGLRAGQAGAVSVTIMLYAGQYAGTAADWWLLALPHAGDQWFCMDAAGQWIAVPAGDLRALRPARQGPLMNVLEPVTILPEVVLPAGLYTLVFALDPLDGVLNYPGGPILMDTDIVTSGD